MSLPMEHAWLQVKRRLENRIPSEVYRVWIEPLRYLNSSESSVVLGCPNKFFINWIRENYGVLLQQELQREIQGTVGFQLTVAKEARESAPADEPKQVSIPAVAEPNHVLRLLNPKFTFDDFVTGASNRFAYSAARDFTLEGDRHHNFLYFFSGPGLGKSHLCQAIGREILTHKPACRLHYLSMEDFINEMIRYLKGNRMPEFKEKYRRNCDILLLEEIHFLSGKERTQDEFAFTLDSLLGMNKKIVVTSAKPPREIQNVHENLRSRLNGGLIAPIDAPGFETRVRILERKAEKFGIRAPLEVLEFLAEHIHSDIRQLESSLICLNARSSLEKQPLNLNLAQEVVRGYVEHKKRLNIETIQEFVAQQFDTTVERMKSKSRKADAVLPRSIAIHLCRKFTDQTLESIGKAFQRHHASVLYALTSLDKKIKKSPGTRRQLEFMVGKMERLLFEPSPASGSSGSVSVS